jgi:dTDP-4-dehydrorhamnose reductase
MTGRISRVVVIGASGQLGRALSAALRQSFEVLEAVRSEPQAGQLRVDLEELDGMRQAIRSARPAWIVIAGAYCNVDGAETERERCLRVNVEGPRAVASCARELGAGVVYYSTDQVFDGTRPAHRELDPVNPLNHYAVSKAQGEAAVAAEAPERHLIIRTAWLYGPDPTRRNFALRLVDRLSAGRPARIPSDQWGTPTYTEDVAAVTRWLMERNRHGTFHAAGPDCVDRVSLARRICAVFGLDEAGLIPIPTAQLGQAARRPLRVRLDCSALRAAGGPTLRGVDAGLDALVRWHEGAVPTGWVPAGKDGIA